MSGFLLSLLLLPWQALACGETPAGIAKDTTNISFNVHHSSFAYKSFEVRRTRAGYSFADPDGESVYFNEDGDPCLDVPSAGVNACGAKLKEILADKEVPLKKGDKTIGMLSFDYERKQVFIWSVNPDGSINKSNLNYVRLTGGTVNKRPYLNVDVMDPRAGKQAGSIHAEREPSPKLRCITIGPDEEYTAGMYKRVENLTGSFINLNDGKFRRSKGPTENSADGGATAAN
jgi:hypothetical protein